MNLSHEIKKVQGLLKIPVSYLEFVRLNSVTVYSDGQSIGGLPCYIISDIYNYDVSENVVNRLEWYKVYQKRRHEIDPLIVENMGRKDINGYAQLFRQVRVTEYEKDIQGRQLALYECFFESEQWRVHRKN
ncbi:hypothetical protein [[Flexibacter] sp. ATCC 35208]|uniref:hypothetical protein n=1 Tax=[Flexibacter] sp. ATCC 35208 TaxID=1936242 RepID=UPI0009CDAC1B|nr:hypothetical protein [[Flexibacter] sp. ATCC 35208]OMP80048.1 hypothetical protein BW716_06025 [[Flexibacter] sp. ATCC 35208]